MITERLADAIDARRDQQKEDALNAKQRQPIPVLADVPAPDASVITAADRDSSVSLDVLITISAGRIEALADLVHGREPSEDRAFARSTCREMWRPVFALAYREQIGQSTDTQRAGRGSE